MDASTANSRFRFPRTVEEESALVSEARPLSSTKYKDKWAVEIFREWQTDENIEISGFGSWKRFQRLRLHPVCSVVDNLEDMDAFSFN